MHHDPTGVRRPEGAPAAVDVPPECICHTQHREAGEVDTRRDVICPMCGAAKYTVEHLQLGCSCYTADERKRMYDKLDLTKMSYRNAKTCRTK